MYKVFFNDRIVFINSSFNKSLSPKGLFVDVSPETDMAILWMQFVNDEQKRDLYLSGNATELIARLFFSNFKIIKAAGGLVFNQNGEILCIERWGKWDLPKGKIEHKEKKKQAALREVEEETGLHGVQLLGKKDITYHIYQTVRYPGQWILKPTYWYKMFYEGNEKPLPQLNEDIVKAEWIAVDQMATIKENTYSSLIPLFDSIS